MKTLFTTKHKLTGIFVLAILCFQIQIGRTQVVLFSEDFETSPVTSILNNWGGETQLPEGPSPCSKGSRGNTTDFNSTHVDFMNSQNSTYFLGVNPEAPCGGYYAATMITDSLDLSSADSLIFKCRYFISDTIGWGPYGITVTLGNPVTEFVIESEFSTLNNWDSVHITVPDSIISNKVEIKILMGGGEAAGVDDIQLIGYYATHIKDNSLNNDIKIYPVPVDKFLNIEHNNAQTGISINIIDLQGKIVYQETSRQTDILSLDIEHLKNGIYILNIIDNAGNPSYHKIVKN